MGVQWTEEQRQVIELGGRNILVSAAAGSGKTAVLVERIITMLTRKENPVDVDRLLIVTFTEAAAAEMKERIRQAIEDQAEKRPEDENLNRQATLIHSAQITTIHSFCLSVIREHFHTIDLDPAFRIGEEGELKLLRGDVMQEMLEQYYEEADPEFLNLIESYGGSRDDKKIEKLIERLYEFSRSYPEPDRWLAECVHAYEVENMEELQATVYYQAMQKNMTGYMAGAKELLQQGLAVCMAPDGPQMYMDALEDDLRQIERLEQAEGYEETYEAIQQIKWKRLASNRKNQASEEKVNFVKQVREDVKGTLKDLKSLYYELPVEDVLAEIGRCRPYMQMLARLTTDFSQRFEEIKRSRNMIDFDDMEQYAMRILTREEDGRLVPSKVAEEYQKQFYEIMIDEYQDSNLIQETILTSVSGKWSDKNNIFMVGDVKQSIYRFRLSRPELFMEKYDSYTLTDSPEQRIDLHKNFRSRKEVLAGANDIFRQIMIRDLGGVEYDDRAALYPGASYPEIADAQADNTPELILVDTEDEAESGVDVEKLSNREKEASVIAGRIHELIRYQMVKDKKTEQMRPAEFRDIVILTRSMKGYADVYMEVLKKEGIPVYAGSSEGYFETREIGVLLDYLRILNNKRQDVPLASVLRSIFGHVTDEELARIKGSYRDRPFHQAISCYAKEGPDEVIKSKLVTCLDQMEHFRRMIPYTALHRLLDKIMQETGYRDYISALPAGEQRAANLDMLLEKARTFESSSYKGVFHFIRYVEQLQKYEIDYGEANTADEQSNTVRLMSIHKSKGLEFPIVIVAGMGKQFNRQDSKGDVLMHASLGIGLESVDLETRTKCPTLIKNVIAREEVLESMGEELRVLYVALTRAKEKLIVTGTLSDPETKVREAMNQALYHKENMAAHPTPMSFGQLAGAKRYLDWILPAVAGRGEKSPFRIRIVDMSQVRGLQIEQTAEQMVTRQALENWNVEEAYDEKMQECLKQQFYYQYPYRDLEGKKLKYTVSELKKRAYLAEEAGELPYEDEPVVPLIPRFLQDEEEITGAPRGTAYHRVMELPDILSAPFLILQEVLTDSLSSIHTHPILYFHAISFCMVNEYIIFSPTFFPVICSSALA
jgi:ATP-dependent helicase/nuclease subunit A